MNDIARCRAEQVRALATYQETGSRGALLGVSDWMLEELIIAYPHPLPPKSRTRVVCGSLVAAGEGMR